MGVGGTPGENTRLRLVAFALRARLSEPMLRMVLSPTESKPRLKRGGVGTPGENRTHNGPLGVALVLQIG